MRIGYIKIDYEEVLTSKNAYFRNAYRIVNENGEDIIQPWFSSISDLKKCAKHLNIKLIKKDKSC